ncbi:MAG: S-layer homology domain-containing protein [Patescibacteria group bacterium]|nr:S-layer homology domain-containing protein [Patescibacteria group bacterium]
MKDTSFLEYLTKGNRKWIAAGMVALIAVSSFALPLKDLFLASMVMVQKSDTFDGAIMPIKKVPNWNGLGMTLAERNQIKYEELDSSQLIDLPEYDPTVLKAEFASLGTSAQDIETINSKITYTILYMGSYSEMWAENAGAHSAVDIIVPTGTPVYAIANAVVQNAYAGKYGEGNAVVLRHDDVPDLENPGATTTYYSAYEHLDGFIVQKGDKIAKGTQIGYSGNTGNSTAPHLHFQIDKASAPYHPYYTMDTKTAKEHTIHPMEFVQKNAVGISSSSKVATADTSTSTDTPVEKTIEASDLSANAFEATSDTKDAEPTDKPTEDSTQTTESIEIKDTEVTAVEFEINIQESELFEKTETTIELTAIDANKEQDKNYNNTVQLSSDSAFGSFTEGSEITFVEGKATVHFTQSLSGYATLTFEDTDRSIVYTTDKLAFASKKEEPIFTDVDTVHKNYASIKFLKENEIINGYADGTFKPSKTVTRAELIKIILLGTQQEVDETISNEFSDVSDQAWYMAYVNNAKKKGIVGGYPDGTFQPEKVVNRVEALKIILETIGVDFPSELTNLYQDTPADAWFAKYAAYCKENNLIDVHNNTLQPTAGMTRADVAELMYRVMNQ